MTKPTEPTNDLITLNHFTARIRDLEMLFRFPEYDREALVEYLATDYGVDRNELKTKSTIEIWCDIGIRQEEYGLAFDYVPSGTFDGQEVGYFRYQLSYGGPTEEFRFFVDPEHNLIKAEFWVLQWFTGSFLDCTDQQTVKAIWQHFKDVESSRYAFRQAMAKK